VADILGVGWKVEDDDENGIDATALIYPERDVLYPQTRILVQWKDGRKSLEGRSFIRRITQGSSLAGDQVVYQKAVEMEEKFHEFHGKEERDEESEVETVPRKVARKARSSKAKKKSISIRSDDEDEEEETVSESEAPSVVGKNTRS
jgi:hypothetical protein